MELTIRLGNKRDLAWAQATVTERHYLHQPVNPQAKPIVYVIEHQKERLGLLMAGTPHATKCRNWWGYEGLPTQWQVLDLCRIWLDPRIQKGGDLCRPEVCPGFTGWRGKWWPSVASWAIETVLSRIQKDWVSMHPPVFPDQPYHITLVISYHDAKYHTGKIYQAAGASLMHTIYDKNSGVTYALPAASGKYCWYWRLPEPAWGWWEIPILQPRTMRLPLEA